MFGSANGPERTSLSPSFPPPASHSRDAAPPHPPQPHHQPSHPPLPECETPHTTPPRQPSGHTTHRKAPSQTGAEGNRDAFLQASEEVISDERSKNHHLLANDLERILYGRAESQATPPLPADRLPKDKERGLPLLQVREPVRLLDDVVLSDENRSLVDELLTEHHRSDLLRSHGLYPADRLLFCGPPGCGKTMTAEVIASELSLPLAIVRIDTIQPGNGGQPAPVFDFITATRWSFDEFDAWPRTRTSTTASKRG